MPIGTTNETSLHRELKLHYAGHDGQTEVEVAGFVTDAVNAAGERIEVQTKSFAPLVRKAKALAKGSKLKVVCPVIVTKYIEVLDEKGKRQYRRKSNKHETPWSLFNALVYAPKLPLFRGLTIELALIDAVEQRVRDGKGSWRRKGMSIHDRQVVTLHECICLKRPADYLRFLPFTGDECFTSTLLSEKAKIGTNLARKTLYVLFRLGLIEKTGKERNAFVYQIVPKKKPLKKKTTPKKPAPAKRKK